MDTATENAAEREETVRIVTEELDRMSRIVEDLLLLAKAERPDFVTPGPVQLAELTADVFVKARALGERDWHLAEVADTEAGLDAQRITQAMVQLAQNAVQHTVPGQRVGIGSRVRDGHIELYVAGQRARGAAAGRRGDLRAVPPGHGTARLPRHRGGARPRHRQGHRRRPRGTRRAAPHRRRRRHLRPHTATAGRGGPPA
ncbi:hypothetical protein SALBM135S_08330 [Streptomyces alboniger]